MGCGFSKGGGLRRGAVAPAPEEPAQAVGAQAGPRGGPTKRRGSVSIRRRCGGSAQPAALPFAWTALMCFVVAHLPNSGTLQVSAEPSGVSRSLSQAAGRQSVANQKALGTRERIRAIVKSTLLFKGALLLLCQNIAVRWRVVADMTR